MHQYPHDRQLFILASQAKPGSILEPLKVVAFCTADYQRLLGTAVQPVQAWKDGL